MWPIDTGSKKLINKLYNKFPADNVLRSVLFGRCGRYTNMPFICVLAIYAVRFNYAQNYARDHYARM